MSSIAPQALPHLTARRWATRPSPARRCAASAPFAVHRRQLLLTFLVRRHGSRQLLAGGDRWPTGWWADRSPTFGTGEHGGALAVDHRLIAPVAGRNAGDPRLSANIGGLILDHAPSSTSIQRMPIGVAHWTAVRWSIGETTTTSSRLAGRSAISRGGPAMSVTLLHHDSHGRDLRIRHRALLLLPVFLLPTPRRVGRTASSEALRRRRHAPTPR